MTLPKHADAAPSPVLPGTLDLLVLKAISLGQEHGYGLLLRIQAVSRGALSVEQGALYPALARLEHQGFIASEWGVSDNKRRAKFYSLTALGHAAFERNLSDWRRMVEAMDRLLGSAALGAQA
jgi:transcriptional regulator